MKRSMQFFVTVTVRELRYVFINAFLLSTSNAEGSGVPRNFFRGGVQQIQLSTEDRENGDLGAVAP